MFSHIRVFVITIILLEFTSTVQAIGKSNSVDIKKSLEEHQGHLLVNKSKANSVPLKIANVSQIGYDPPKKKKKDSLRPITLELIQEWAKDISNILHENENLTVRRDELLKGFSDIKIEERNGTAIVEKAAKALEELLERRGRVAESIMRKAEELAAKKEDPPSSYAFISSIKLDELKELTPDDEKPDEKGKQWDMPLNCTDRHKMLLMNSAHFDAKVSLEHNSVHVATEVFECDSRVLNHIYWTEGLADTFRDNYAKDATLDLQYMCSAKGFMRHYPAALWSSMYKLKVDGEELYDCRLRPWYVSAGGAPRDVLVLLDASGSMSNSSNLMKAEQFTLALLSALTDDDQVNVLRYNVVVESPIPCFNESLVPANHVNSAAMMAVLPHQNTTNETLMADAIHYSMEFLKRQREAPGRPPSCQQALVLVTDSLYDNYTDLMRSLDPEGYVRLFVLWLHDRFGLRDDTQVYGESVSCDRDGYFAELITHADVTEQVMNILRVLERPLVAQRKHRLRVYSDVYANVEDPRRSEYYWQQKENAEQVYRYAELRRNKDQFLATTRQYGDYLHMRKLEKYGQYYEGEEINYRLQVSVSVPVFDSTTVENITITLDEEKQRNATRTYPVNRLLGVAGVDIPLDHLKLILPYHLVGAGGSLFIIDHRGNIVIHNNAKPVFDGDILRPGYRTVDFLDVEQPAKDHYPRHYPPEWLEFRNSVVIEQPDGHRTMEAKSIFEGGMRVILEKKDYFWKRVMEQYTVLASLPKYTTKHAVPDKAFTQKLGEEAWKALNSTDFSVHPDWLYCRHVDPHFKDRKDEIMHFIERRKNEPKFAMRKITHLFSPIKPTAREQSYQCNEELMARLSKEAVATYRWMQNENAEETCSDCKLGSNIAFFASESGLMRWQLFRATSRHAQPPDTNEWAHGPTEPWYRRAAAAPSRLVVHAPVAPVRVMRNSDLAPPPLGEKWYWLTAARALSHPDKGFLGVAGYHFYPQHLRDVLNSYTNFPCPEEEEDICEPHCDGVIWTCLLIDDGGWIVSTNGVKEETEDERLREHLANAYPAAMSALLNANIFKIRWVHDYQAVCFPPVIETLKSAAPLLSSVLRSMWTSVQLLVHISREVFTLITILTSCGLARGETEAEKEKRRKYIREQYEREKYERLYDPRVLVNRTRFAACDRSRALYEFQRTPKSLELLRRTPNPCKWPLIGTEVPGTNLLLLAVYTNCSNTGKPVNNPFYNQLVTMDDGDEGRVRMAARLACWRNRVPLPARAPHTACYPHDYSTEAGYRQCGPWLPDPDIASDVQLSNLLLFIVILNLLINITI
ncbi:voltage-dependent calcium channel subunit alpha-2/delta-3 [Bicyclus anynana]|uniref:Voltage-dependent calcium channel subunit alpha-2/delta-3 n=1 Tax=Bicyclus anynana TaxID=110368 RepID=A0ABM3LTH6_BICAN|nr:voltage-dependent calcium channel subunit alpha-2/delta-3 [Bicyclus anynana]XP_052742328.1 voltage-dependent calcium channel subunit alpha-2/delta-3 [Bicyclus anynana]